MGGEGIFNPAILLAFSLVCGITGGIIKNSYCKVYGGAGSGRHFFNAVTSISASLVLLIWGGFGDVSVFTVLSGIAFGVITAVQMIFNMKALEVGSFTYTTVIVSLSTLIPTLSGMLFWEEIISPVQYIGIALMMVCFVFSVNKDSNQKKVTWRWLIYCAVTFVCTGAIGIMQKTHQSSDYKSELNAFLIIAFAVSFIYSFVSWLIMRRHDVKQEIKRKQQFTVIFLIIVSGATVAVCNKLNLYLSGVMDSAIFFPVVNGGSLILTAVSAVILFHERFSVKQWIGVFLGTVSVVFLCNPF